MHSHSQRKYSPIPLFPSPVPSPSPPFCLFLRLSLSLSRSLPLSCYIYPLPSPLLYLSLSSPLLSSLSSLLNLSIWGTYSPSRSGAFSSFGSCGSPAAGSRCPVIAPLHARSAPPAARLLTLSPPPRLSGLPSGGPERNPGAQAPILRASLSPRGRL